MEVKVKICGITSPREAEILNASGADYAGFVMFYEKSRRNNTVENAWKVLRYLDRKIQRVAVTVSPTREQIGMLEQMDFQIIQIHGELSEEAAQSCSLPIWRAYNLAAGKLPERIPYEDKITGYVLDGAVPGSGAPFDWKAHSAFERKGKLLILAGGLRPDNVGEAIKTLSPNVVDVSSGVEGPEGKDAQKIKEFIGKVKTHE